MDNGDFTEVLLQLLSSTYDKEPTRNEKYAKQLVGVHEEFVKRNEKLTRLLTDFIDQRKERIRTNKFLKKFIFWFFVSMLGVLTITVALFVVFNIDNVKTIPAVIALVSISVTYLVSLIAVLEVMSKYLFPVDEEKDTIAMIKAVIKNDVQVEKLMSAAISKSRYDEIEWLKKVKELHDGGVLSEKEFTEWKEHLLKKMKREK